MINIGHLFVPVRNKFTSSHTHCEPTEELPSSGNKWDPNWDLRQHKGSQAVRQIVLIRHGQYEQGVKGDENKVLTPLGMNMDNRLPSIPFHFLPCAPFCMQGGNKPYAPESVFGNF